MNKKELFYNIEDHLLHDEKPSIYLNDLKENGYLDKEPFVFLKRLEKANQSPKHHPEGNVWIHTMMVIDEGVKLRNKVSDPAAFMWALLLHDIGKFSATRFRNGRITSYEHDKIGENEARLFLTQCVDDEEFIEKVQKLVRYHMHLLFFSNNMKYGNEKGMLKEADLDLLVAVFQCDRIGRGGIGEKEKKDILDQIEKFKNTYMNK